MSFTQDEVVEYAKWLGMDIVTVEGGPDPADLFGGVSDDESSEEESMASPEGGGAAGVAKPPTAMDGKPPSEEPHAGAAGDDDDGKDPGAAGVGGVAAEAGDEADPRAGDKAGVQAAGAAGAGNGGAAVAEDTRGAGNEEKETTAEAAGAARAAGSGGGSRPRKTLPRMSDDSIILEEEIDPNYEPTQGEVVEYAKWLGMDIVEDEYLMWIAREGLKAPLPENWKPCKTTDTDEIYYFNFSTGDSTWDHPCDEKYRFMYEEEKKRRNGLHLLLDARFGRYVVSTNGKMWTPE